MAQTTESSTAPDPPKEPRKPWRRRGWGVVVVVTTLISLIAGSIAIWQIVPRHHLDIAFTNPEPGKITMVACNVPIAGRGTAPAGQVIVVSNQEQGTGDNIDPNLYFAKADEGSSGWSVDERIGTSKTGAGTPYTVTVWLVDNKWTDYLTNLTNLVGVNTGQNAWWSSHGPPPGASMVQTVNVTRSAGKC
jgi:hypothetical protein